MTFSESQALWLKELSRKGRMELNQNGGCSGLTTTHNKDTGKGDRERARLGRIWKLNKHRKVMDPLVVSPDESKIPP